VISRSRLEKQEQCAMDIRHRDEVGMYGPELLTARIEWRIRYINCLMRVYWCHSQATPNNHVALLLPETSLETYGKFVGTLGQHISGS
jgi:hypothetical protein